MSEEESNKLTFTQEEFDKIISDRLMRERDKTKETINSLQQENESYKSKLTDIELSQLKSNLLSQAGLSPNWAAKITGKTEPEIKAEIESFKGLLESSKPEPLGAATNPPESKPVTYSRAQIKSMSPIQINENWEAIQRSLRSGI